MTTIDAMLRAQIQFARMAKKTPLESVQVDLAEDTKTVLVLGIDRDGSIGPTITFTINPRAWTKHFQQQIERNFFGSAQIARRGR